MARAHVAMNVRSLSWRTLTRYDPFGKIFVTVRWRSLKIPFMQPYDFMSFKSPSDPQVWLSMWLDSRKNVLNHTGTMIFFLLTSQVFHKKWPLIGPFFCNLSSLGKGIFKNRSTIYVRKYIFFHKGLLWRKSYLTYPMNIFFLRFKFCDHLNIFIFS